MNVFLGLLCRITFDHSEREKSTYRIPSAICTLTLRHALFEEKEGTLSTLAINLMQMCICDVSISIESDPRFPRTNKRAGNRSERCIELPSALTSSVTQMFDCVCQGEEDYHEEP